MKSVRKSGRGRRGSVGALGLYAPASIDHCAGNRLPYVDSLVNLIIQGPFSGGRVAEAEFEPDVAKVCEIQVSVDLATGEMAMTVGGATVTTTLDPIPKAISYVGVGAASAAVDFSRVKISAR